MTVGAGQIVLVTGPSGAGKTTLLEAIARRVGRAVRVRADGFPSDAAIIDVIAPRRPIDEAMAVLSACGLAEPRLWLRRFGELSDGQRFRAALARMVGEAQHGDALIVCDEFVSLLDRPAAQAVAFNLRKLVTRRGLRLVAATAHEDVIADLQPDRLIRLHGDGSAAVTRRTPGRRRVSFLSRLRIAPASLRDYRRWFAAMHYRSHRQVAFVDKVFAIREPGRPQPLGIVVYAYPPLELALRNWATGDRFRGNPGRLNREVRILRRLVVQPDLRGCGLGQWLVRQTLGWLGVEWVECLSAMGTVSAVFRRAGMRRIGRCDPSAQRRRRVARLAALGVEPQSPDLAEQMSRRPEVERLVREAVVRWYEAAVSDGRGRAAAQSNAMLAETFRRFVGSRPVYYLWRRPGTV